MNVVHHSFAHKDRRELHQSSCKLNLREILSWSAHSCSSGFRSGGGQRDVKTSFPGMSQEVLHDLALMIRRGVFQLSIRRINKLSFGNVHDRH